ncbi:MAG: hypothetical protein OXD44_00475, partial [Gammaproteobacteria bacterium]|nr:hypothetical protein [Gammaproteobacteria bacterium]
EETDGLFVHVRPREWVDSRKRFACVNWDIGCNGTKYLLKCPNFRKAPPRAGTSEIGDVKIGESSEKVQSHVLDMSGANVEREMGKSYSQMLLHFFRDISSSQRLGILAGLGAIPPDFEGTVNETLERRAFDSLIRAGRSDELFSTLCNVMQEESRPE